MRKNVRLRLITPEKTLFEGEATSVSGRSPGGEFEVRPGHGAWVSPLEIGVLAARPSAGARPAYFAVHGGLIEVGSDRVLVLADVAESEEEIDPDRARRARERAAGRLASPPPDGTVDPFRAQLALARASARLHVATIEP
jgi:F-type H+-transporting ATPase subunit epsilon